MTETPENKRTSISPWQYKPWWCQPWSIVLTGIALIAGSWFTLKLIWLTILVAVPVCCWMGFFLLIWPKLMMDAILHPDDQNFEAKTDVEPIN